MKKKSTKWAIRLATLITIILWGFSAFGLLLAAGFQVFETESYIETNHATAQIYQELGRYTNPLFKVESEAIDYLKRQGKIPQDYTRENPSTVAENRIMQQVEYTTRDTLRSMEDYFAFSNVDVRVEEYRSGEVLVDTFGAEGYGPLATFTTNCYSITAAIQDPIGSFPDYVYQGNLVYGTLDAMVSAMILALVVTTLLSLAGVWALVKTAPTIPGKLERIPTDIFLFAGCVGLFLLQIPIYYYMTRSIRTIVNFAVDSTLLHTLSLAGFGFLFSGILVETLVVSTAKRAKSKTFWLNTMVAILWRWTGGALVKLPTIWRACLVALGVFGINGILGMLSVQSAFSWILFALYNLILVVTVCGFAWQMKQLQEGAKQLASGNLTDKIDTSHLYYDCKLYGETLNTIAGGMTLAVEEKIRSQRLKTELITNVSHDIKTPLTSIVTSVELLQKDHTEEEHQEYLDLLQRQSMKLKRLVEDLVEASKAATGNVTVHLEQLDLVEILDQALGEYQTKLEGKNLILMAQLPETCPVLADGKLLWRVLDNLLGNVCKYALEGTRVYVSVTQDTKVRLTLKNISASPLNLSAEDLMERFVRGDASRTTEGAGLGLNIAQSLMQLQNGSLELTVDGDLFKVELTL